MSEYKDYPEISKEGGGGFRRFLLLVAVVVGLAFVVAAWSGRAVVTENHGGVADVVTTPTAPAAAVAVNVNQSAPAVNIAIEQPPAPAPVPTSDYAIQLAFMESQRAFNRGDEAYRLAERAYGAADSLHYRVAALETIAAAPPTPSTELQLLRFDVQTNKYTNHLLTAGLFAMLLIVMALAGWVTWRTTPPYPTTITAAPPPTPMVLENQHGVNTVQHGVDTVQQTTSPVHSTTSGDILRPLNLRPRPLPMPKRLDELTDEQRRYIQQTYNRLKTFSGTSRHIWNYHNATTLGIVKDVVGQGDSQRLQ